VDPDKNSTVRKLFSIFLLCAGWLACDTEAPPVITDPTTTEPALNQLTAAIAQDPDNSELYAQRGRLQYEREAYDQAIKDLQRAIQLDSVNVDYYHLLADDFLDYFQSRRALNVLQRAAELYPERIPTLLKLSEVQLILQQHEESMRTIDRILKIDPREPEAFFMFGMNFKEMGDTSRAINAFQEVVEIDPDITDAWIMLGQLHAAKNTGLADAAFRSAIETSPNDPTTYHAKGDYLRDQGRLSEAIAAYRQAAQVERQYDEAYFNAGLLLMELDSVPEAFREFNIAIEVNPIHIRAYFFRGYAAELLGDTEQARRDYAHALRLAPDYQLPQEGLARLDPSS
jgi:tetratricopeptide (TPR) repeat protein